MKTICIILLGFMLISSGSAQAQRKDKAQRSMQAEQQFKAVKSLIESHQFQIHIDRAYPMSGSDLSRFNPEGTITVNNDTARGKLPYFGRAYSLPYGEGGGIEFDGTVKEPQVRTIEKKKNKSVLYQFNVAGKNDIYRIAIEAFPGNTCNVNINSNNRANISYSGKISSLDEETETEQNKK